MVTIWMPSGLAVATKEYFSCSWVPCYSLEVLGVSVFMQPVWLPITGIYRQTKPAETEEPRTEPHSVHTQVLWCYFP